jgi:tetratricopeptide (TPR) repeat protein
MRMNDILKSRNEPQLLDEHINILNSLVAVCGCHVIFELIIKAREEEEELITNSSIFSNLQRFPIYCAFRHDLAVTLIKKGFYREAQSAEQAALSCTNWCRSDYIVSLVEIYMKQNQLWKAESLLRRALILFEDGTGLHLLGTQISRLKYNLDVLNSTMTHLFSHNY